MTQTRPRGRLQFLLLAALFFAPLLAAVLLYFVFPQWTPSGRVNKGELIDPARPIPTIEALNESGQPAGDRVLRGRWSFVYIGGTDCDAACVDKLYQIRQLRTLLNEKRLRVRRVYLAPSPAAAAAAHAQLAAEHPDLLFLADTANADYRRFFEGGDPQSLYLVDPLGNWLMRYAGDTDPKDVLSDIRKLLRISQIG
jgi:hypothetical protein